MCSEIDGKRYSFVKHVHNVIPKVVHEDNNSSRYGPDKSDDLHKFETLRF